MRGNFPTGLGFRSLNTKLSVHRHLRIEVPDNLKMSSVRPSWNTCTKHTNQIQMTLFLNLVYSSSRNMNNRKERRTSVKTHSHSLFWLAAIKCCLIDRGTWIAVEFNVYSTKLVSHGDQHAWSFTSSSSSYAIWSPFVSWDCLSLCVCVCVSVFLQSRTRMPMCVCLFVSWNLALLGVAWESGGESRTPKHLWLHLNSVGVVALCTADKTAQEFPPVHIFFFHNITKTTKRYWARRFVLQL